MLQLPATRVPGHLWVAVCARNGQPFLCVRSPPAVRSQDLFKQRSRTYYLMSEADASLGTCSGRLGGVMLVDLGSVSLLGH